MREKVLRSGYQQKEIKKKEKNLLATMVLDLIKTTKNFLVNVAQKIVVDTL